MSSGFANYFTIVHLFGWSATPDQYGNPFTLINLATILERAWDLINKPDLVATLDRAVRERNANLPEHQSLAKQFYPLLTPMPAAHRNLFTSTEGLFDVNTLAPEMIIGMLWHEQVQAKQPSSVHASATDIPSTSPNINALDLPNNQAPAGDIMERGSKPQQFTEGTRVNKLKTSASSFTSLSSASPPSAITTAAQHHHTNIAFEAMAQHYDCAEEQRQVSPHGELAMVIPLCACAKPCKYWYTSHSQNVERSCVRASLTSGTSQTTEEERELLRRRAALASWRQQMEEEEAALRREEEALSRRQREAAESLAVRGHASALGSNLVEQEVVGAGDPDIAHNFDRALAPARQYADQQREDLRQWQQRSRAGSNPGQLVHVPDHDRPKAPAAGKKQKYPINLELYGVASGQRYPSEAMARPSITNQPPPVYGQANSLLASDSESTLRGPAATARSVQQQTTTTPTRGERFAPYRIDTAATSHKSSSTDSQSSSEGLFSQSIRRKPVGSSKTSLQASSEQTPSRCATRVGEENPNDTFVFPDSNDRDEARRRDSQATEDDALLKDFTALQPAPLRMQSTTHVRDLSQEALMQRIAREEQEGKSDDQGYDELTVRPTRARADTTVTEVSDAGPRCVKEPHASASPYGYGGTIQQAVTDYGTFNPYADDPYEHDDTAASDAATTSADPRAIPRVFDEPHTGYHPYPQAYSHYPNPYNTSATPSGYRTSEDQVPSYRSRTSDDQLPAYTHAHQQQHQAKPTGRRPSNYQTPDNKPSIPPSAYNSSARTSAQLSACGSRSNSASIPPLKQRYVSAGGTAKLHERAEVASPFSIHGSAPKTGASVYPPLAPEALMDSLEHLQLRQQSSSATPCKEIHTTPIEVPAGGMQPDSYGWERAFADGERSVGVLDRDREGKEKARKESNAAGNLKDFKKRLFSRSVSQNKEDGKGEDEWERRFL